MRGILAVTASVLLILIETGSAQSQTYSASISFHSSLQDPPLTETQVKKILADASKMLQEQPDTSGGDVKCAVTFTLQGPVRTFSDPPNTSSSKTLAIVTKSNRDAVHKVDAHVPGDFHIKVVKEIDFCRQGLPPGPQAGCSFSPHAHFRSIIVIDPRLRLPTGHLLLAHEFGHLTGLPHRDDDPDALMTRCSLPSQFNGIPDAQVHVTAHECRHLRAGPGHSAAPPLQGVPHDCR
jgi:hypothetical protein